MSKWVIILVNEYTLRAADWDKSNSIIIEIQKLTGKY